MGAWPIILPESAGGLEIQLTALDEMATHRERENETLTDLRDTLLPRLVSGEIPVRDAENVAEEVL
jgi:type I restriction enzyme S subunit